MRLLFADPAANDLADIIDDIALDNPPAAERIFRAISDTAQRLIRFPDSGRPGRLAGTREIPVPDLPYLVVYQAIEDTVTVLAVFHGARDLAKALDERRQELKR
ncbi:type II toxin-antitoxin system RelE/ParE family toxin [Radicibacter daui]|uniref:type II toxin-antitoxin system RelE/ParE family toxin n=1 Tax=Radicibacter daui TaxID=3064829 RepID=UPI004046BED8